MNDWFPIEVTRFTPHSLDALLESSELYLKSVMEDAYMICLHSKRVTLMKKDIQIYKWLKDGK